jgi:hypothetical protein
MSLKSLISIFFLVLIIALAIGVANVQTVQAATRDLVFEDDDEAEVSAAKAEAEAGIQNPEVISVKTTFDLTKDNETESVPSNFEFKSGDKIKLRYTTNTDGYAYWMAKMSSGQYTILFPSKETGTDNFVKKNENQTVPLTGYFRFDENPGKEQLLLIFATEKISELEQAIVEAAEKNGKIEQNIPKIAALEIESTKKTKTRDLVFEDEDDQEVNTKTQAGTSGEPFVAYYELIHN